MLFTLHFYKVNTLNNSYPSFAKYELRVQYILLIIWYYRNPIKIDRRQLDLLILDRIKKISTQL